MCKGVIEESKSNEEDSSYFYCYYLIYFYCTYLHYHPVRRLCLGPRAAVPALDADLFCCCKAPAVLPESRAPRSYVAVEALLVVLVRPFQSLVNLRTHQVLFHKNIVKI